VADLGPFTAVDAAATVSANRDRVAVTLVNRQPEQPEITEIVLRDHAFAGPAEIRTVTSGGPRVLPDVEAARLEQGTETAKNGSLVLTLPPQSFTLIEAALTR
jgi:hypothetical protein